MYAPEDLAEMRLDSADPDHFAVRHASEGHRYVFHVDVKRGRRVLSWTCRAGRNPAANFDAEHYVDCARWFAELEARDRKLID
jgi:hypothetical protein